MKISDRFYINGQWQVPSTDDRMEVINPFTQTSCVSVPRGHQVDVEAAIRAARDAWPAWAATPAKQRHDLLMAAADEMQRRYQDLVEALVITLGSPIKLTGGMHVDGPIEGLRYYARRTQMMDEVECKEGGAMIVKEPIGVCALINPWNYPLHQLVGKLAPALAAGCTVVVKPAEQTPLQDFIMAEIFHAIGLPAGVFNLVTGSGREIGPVLAGHPEVDMVSFTGSTAAGITVAQNAAPTVKRVCQELGGKSPLIITQDADLPLAVRYGVEGLMSNTGQTCDALTRMLIPRSRYEEAVTLARNIALEQVVGDPRDPATTMGPLVSQRQKEIVLGYIQQGIDEGARLVTGGLEPPVGLASGAFVRPTVFADVTNEMIIAKEEIFGPVLCILAYDDIEDAVRVANDTVYGLSSGVHAENAESATCIARRLKAGQCHVQGGDASIDTLLSAPFGGYKQSGNGREWGEQGMHEYIEVKAIIGG